MENPGEAITAAIHSGEADQVNQTIDDLGEVDPGERIRVFESCFDRCRELYRETDGYQRQSVVRILETLTPATGLAAYVIDDGSRFPDDVSRETFEDAMARATPLFIEALGDDDGRVRRAAILGIKDVCVGYDMAGEDEPIQAIVAELDDLLAQESGAAQKHIQEAREQAAFYLQPSGERLFTAIQELVDERQ